MRIGYCSNLRLHLKSKSYMEEFFLTFSEKTKNLDAMLLLGNTADYMSICHILLRLNEYSQCPLYFVVGDEDLYYNTYNEIKDDINRRIGKSFSNLMILDNTAIRVNNVCIIGIDPIAGGNVPNDEFSAAIESQFKYIAKPDLRRKTPDDVRNFLVDMSNVRITAIQRCIQEGNYIDESEKVIILSQYCPFYVKEDVDKSGALLYDCLHNTHVQLGDFAASIAKNKPTYVFCGTKIHSDSLEVDGVKCYFTDSPEISIVEI